MLLTELAVGLGPSSAPGAAAPFAPKPHVCLICSHTTKLDPPLPRPLGRGIKLAKNWGEHPWKADGWQSKPELPTIQLDLATRLLATAA